MGKRQEAALETRRSIVEAVKILMQDKKVEDISIEDITTTAGVAKGSFYTYFKRKEDIVSELALQKFDVLKEYANDATKSVYQQIRHYLEKSVEIIEESGLEVAQQWMKSVAAPLEEEQQGIKKYQYDVDNITHILQRAAERGEFQKNIPLEIMGVTITNTYYGAVLAWCITKGAEGELIRSIDDFCENVLPLLLNKYSERKDEN